MPVLHSGNIASQQASPLFDFTLRELLLFAQDAQAIADNHGSPILDLHIEMDGE
jgi:hypothetical protein